MKRNSDELKAAIESLKGNDEKIRYVFSHTNNKSTLLIAINYATRNCFFNRCILNKADQVDRQKSMRVYGALMWSLGKVVKTPEVLRVYVGSFWDQPLIHADNAALFEAEEADLMKDLKDLPRNR